MEHNAIDWADPQLQEDPYPVYARLRRERPLAAVSGRNWYAVSRYADVQSVLEQPELFSSVVMRRADPTLLGADPPEHTAARRIAQQALASAGDLRPMVEAAAGDLAEHAITRTRWDFVSDFAAVLPALVMARLLGLEATPAELLGWTRASTPRTRAGAPSDEDVRQAVELDQHLAELVQQRAAEPDGGFVAALLANQEGARALTPRQASSVAKIVLIGGVETTAHWMGNAMRALLSRPRLLAAAAEDAQACEQFVVEVLRYDPPVQVVLRRAARPVRIGGAVAPAGATVGALLGSANRDEAVFEQPDEIRLDRPPSPPALSFGRGPHVCLGARLAKLEAAVGLHALVSRAPSIGAAEDLQALPMADSLHLRGPERLLVRM